MSIEILCQHCEEISKHKGFEFYENYTGLCQKSSVKIHAKSPKSVVIDSKSKPAIAHAF
jgi:hypothetical protein